MARISLFAAPLLGIFVCFIALHSDDSRRDAALQSVLKAADLNRNGTLSLKEYLPLDVQAKHHGEEHFKAGDRDNNGELDALELAEVLRKQTWFAILAEGTEQCFTRIDVNKNGKLEYSEYQKVSRMPNHAEQHFKHWDADKDGLLSLTEFTAHANEKLKALGAVK